MEITEDFPQKNCKYKPKVNGRKPKQMLEEHRKKRENRDSVGGRNHLKINGILGLNDERVLVPDDSKDLITKKFFDVIENKNKIEVDEPCCALDPIGSQAGKSGYPEVSPTTNGPLEFSIPDTPPRSQESYVVKANGFDIESVDTIEESVYCPASSNKEDDSPIDSGVFSSYSPEAFQVLEINTDEGIDLSLSNDAFDISKENTRPKSIQENKAEIEVEESVALLSDVTKCPEQFSFEENNKNVDITEVAPSESTQQPEALLKDKAETSEDQLPGSGSENVDLVVDEELDASSVLETTLTEELQSSDCASPVRVPPSTADASAGVLMPTPGPSSQLDTPHLLRSAGGQKRKANLAYEFIKKKKKLMKIRFQIKELELKEKQIELERKKLELEEQKERNKENSLRNKLNYRKGVPFL
ncbi:hypothetical protein JTE90_006420 [Oedothorax gibbosus]|uniref:Uncharacterized protein n=1 Tax=Oedothorax gibbosus TaxID=931172 RepID=A0AAV6VYQ2_9ARAC|nr:hypothetical protein JTE90_006420 [Oedothorax gibbosus]